MILPEDESDSTEKSNDEGEETLQILKSVVGEIHPPLESAIVLDDMKEEIDKITKELES